MFYRTPKIHYDRATHRGRPFYYFAYGAGVSEVIIDTLTGENRVLRADIHPSRSATARSPTVSGGEKYPASAPCESMPAIHRAVA